MQFEFPWALGPADGRYVVREAAEAPPTHVLVLATLGAPERRRLRGRRGRAPSPPEPPPTPVTTARATVIDALPVPRAEAERWLADASTSEAETALTLVARAVRAHRVTSADAAVREPALGQALVMRVGHGRGEQVAAGRWSAARELAPAHARQRRTSGLLPQERVAALLGGHAHTLVCEEMTLRARQDLDAGQLRQAALQLRTALAAALVELPAAADAPADMPARVADLRERAPAISQLADAALGGALPANGGALLAETLRRLEAALRARIASLASSSGRA